MILHEPVLAAQPDRVRMGCAVRMASGETTELWYELPAGWKDSLSESSDAFVCGLLLLAMKRGEDIEAAGAVSSAFLDRLPAYQDVFANWFPRTYRRVAVHAAEIAPVEPPSEAEASAFSGGVDSFYTLRTRLLASAAAARYAVFVHGFDLPLSDSDGYRWAADAYEQALSELNIQLVRVRTNVRSVLSAVDWEMAHGPALISVAVLLRRLFGRFYTPSSATRDDDSPWGSDPRCDPLLSVPSLEIVHDSADVHRAEKLRVLAEWPLAWPLLRVCWENPQGPRNCGRCFKCLSTMLALDLCGALGRFPVFHGALTPEAVREVSVPVDEFYFARTLIERLRAGSRPEYASALRTALSRSQHAEQWNSVRRLLRRARRRVHRTVRSALS